ncbi:YheT family hydrolase [Mangrovitalea sediminis]|uniref:YheT family hydrolase n=1 Tax=Mangrovitalea sediminis TaxID=1982043 RepID=UPI001304069E|nr:alpha/beta fold hydrolase [Mangrovitalea sediminis]
MPRHVEIVEGWRPASSLRNPHVQSMLASIPLRRPAVKRQSQALRVRSEERILLCRDGIRLHGMLSRHGDRPHPLVLMIHGWEGSAESLYLLSAASALFTAGFDVFRLHLRDHGPSYPLNRQLFNAGRLGEVLDAVCQVQAEEKPPAFFLAGFSMGGNFTLRVAAAAESAGLPLDGAIAVSPVLEPRSSLEALDQGPWLYRRYFLHNWREALRRKSRCFPDLIDWSRVEKLETITALTEYCVEYHSEFPDLQAYLNGYAVTGDRLSDLSVPTWLIMADDDPINPAADLARLAGSERLHVVRTGYGGHCGFIDDWRFNSWVDRFLVRQFRALLPAAL